MKKIFLFIAPLLIFMLAFRPINNYQLKGQVTDEKGNPLVSATITEKGSTTSSTTDQTGNYSILLSNSKATIIVSAVGYMSKEIKVNGHAVVNVKLKAVSATLQEVVVVGYGQKVKKDVTGSISYQFSQPVKSYQPGVQIEIKNGYKGEDDNTTQIFSREGYDNITENIFLRTNENPLSTFSIDVDAASYSNVRRFINQGQLPPAGAVRIEEMVNYFHYEYPQPTNGDPFSINTEVTEAPWNKNHQLVLIGLQGIKIPTENLPSTNLVFLIDVSGSMESPNKLPLVKASLKMLVDQLRPNDRVAIVVYAGAAGLVLPSTNGNDKTKIKEAINNLSAGGSTAGGAGIKLAYKTARENFVQGGNNRVILCTDGDFNVGASSDDEMERLIEVEKQSGVFLTVLGYGMGNYQDSKMQKLADKGNGNHAYIDGISEAKKVLVNEFGGTLFTIAKDVKLQVEFNPAKVQGYRLIGYENRMLAKEDFNDDKKDAGELGSGHTVTALYEIIPVGVKSDFLKNVDGLKYQKNVKTVNTSDHNGELLTVKFRYKAPDGDESKLIVHPLIDHKVALVNASGNLRFAASVAQFGMLLRESTFKSAASYANVLKLAKTSLENDEEGYRREFVRLVESAKLLSKSNVVSEEELDGVGGER